MKTSNAAPQLERAAYSEGQMYMSAKLTVPEEGTELLLFSHHPIFKYDLL